MNGTVGRRVFVGSLAGAGVGALGATSLLDLPLAAQHAGADPLTREIRHQLKQAFGKMQNGDAAGARQAATTMRLYASTVDDNQFRAALKRADRQKMLASNGSHRAHSEANKLAIELGIDPSKLPPHAALDLVAAQAMLVQLQTEGFAPSMQRTADALDTLAGKFDDLARRGRTRAQVRAISMQPIPDPVDCGNCDNEWSYVEYSATAAAVACAAAELFPPLAPICAAASANFLAAYSLYMGCYVFVLLCRAYYD